MNLSNEAEGRNTSLGQTETHSWQAVQCWAKSLALQAPGGTIGTVRFGAFFSTIVAKPPSTFFSWAFRAEVVATNETIERNSRRPSPSFFTFFSAFPHEGT